MDKGMVVRESVMYLLILAGFRIFRRDAGSLSVSDLLVVVLIADAAQNGMAGEYKSVTEGAIVWQPFSPGITREQLREQGVEDIRNVKKCFLEGDGRMSVIRKDGDQSSRPVKKRQS